MLQQVDDLEHQRLELRHAVGPRGDALELTQASDEGGVQALQHPDDLAIDAGQGRCAGELGGGPAQNAARLEAAHERRVLLQRFKHALERYSSRRADRLDDRPGEVSGQRQPRQAIEQWRLAVLVGRVRQVAQPGRSQALEIRRRRVLRPPARNVGTPQARGRDRSGVGHVDPARDPVGLEERFDLCGGLRVLRLEHRNDALGVGRKHVACENRVRT